MFIGTKKKIDDILWAANWVREVNGIKVGVVQFGLSLWLNFMDLLKLSFLLTYFGSYLLNLLKNLNLNWPLKFLIYFSMFTLFFWQFVKSLEFKIEKKITETNRLKSWMYTNKKAKSKFHDKTPHRIKFHIKILRET